MPVAVARIENAVAEEDKHVTRLGLKVKFIVLRFVEQAERQAIIDALIAASGRIAGKGGPAERLGLKRTTLQNKMNVPNISHVEYSG